MEIKKHTADMMIPMERKRAITAVGDYDRIVIRLNTRDHRGFGIGRLQTA